jgi:hypothetical protein
VQTTLKGRAFQCALSSCFCHELVDDMNDGVKLRYDIDAEGVKGLLLINGGASVALLAFLPNALSAPSNYALAHGIFCALILYQAGLVLAIIHNRLRRICSLTYDQRRLTPCRFFAGAEKGVRFI